MRIAPGHSGPGPAWLLSWPGSSTSVARLLGRDPADRVNPPCELKSLLTSPLGALRPARERLAPMRVWPHSLLPGARARFAAGGAVAAAIGAVSLEIPSAIL